jgi:hypothetical protein
MTASTSSSVSGSVSSSSMALPERDFEGFSSLRGDFTALVEAERLP